MGISYRILLVDTDSPARADLVRGLQGAGFSVSTAGDLAAAGGALEPQTTDALVCSLDLPDGPGIELLAAARRHSRPPVALALATAPGVKTVVSAMREGAVDVLQRPVTAGQVEAMLRPALDKRRVRLEGVPEQATSLPPLSRPPIIGSSDGVRQVMEQVRRVAATSATTVLLQGESGTGKELVARAIHFDGVRRERPFKTINCGALNESILEAELYGFDKGALSGPDGTVKKGLFETAHGGTVFLDEVGELSPSLQARLLRILEEGRLKRIGGVQDVVVDVRVIGAASRDLWEVVSQGRFRKDLYFRLNVMPIRIPALRERREDVSDLARHFLSRFGEAMHKPLRGLSAEAERMLMEHTWPGNVRELRNVCEYAVIVCDGNLVDPRHLALTHVDVVGSPVPEAQPENVLPLKDWSLRTMEEELIRRVLLETRFNITRSARELGINRSTLYNKMREYGLSRDRAEMKQGV